METPKKTLTEKDVLELKEVKEEYNGLFSDLEKSNNLILRRLTKNPRNFFVIKRILLHLQKKLYTVQSFYFS